MDRRDSRHDWYSRFDEKAMTLTIYEDDEAEFTVPAKYDVCGTCDGKGSHVNPSIDAHGISPEEFAEDPDFREDYFGGAYDVACNECRGKRVVPVADEGLMTPEEAKKVEEAIDQFYEDRRCEEYERRMGY